MRQEGPADGRSTRHNPNNHSPRDQEQRRSPAPWQHHQQFNYAETQVSFAEGNQEGPAHDRCWPFRFPDASDTSLHDPAQILPRMN
jgi:hypothetical protein